MCTSLPIKLECGFYPALWDCCNENGKVFLGIRPLLSVTVDILWPLHVFKAGGSSLMLTSALPITQSVRETYKYLSVSRYYTFALANQFS